MGLVTKNFTFSAGATVIASEHNANFDTLYNLVNGTLDNTNISASAAIADSKLATISTAQKVNTSALVTTSQVIGDTLYADTATTYTRRAVGGANTFFVGGTTPSYRAFAPVSDISGTIPPVKGGLGTDASAIAQGRIPFLLGTGVFSFLSSGTSGNFLKSNGAASNPTWSADTSLSNVVLEWHGSEAGAAAMQLNTAQGIAADNYVYYSTDSNSAVTCLRTKFRKIAGMTTANIDVRMRLANAGETATVTVDIGGQNTTITHTGDSVITAKSGTITVSSLTNGTLYDMIVQLTVSGSSFCELYDIIITMT